MTTVFLKPLAAIARWCVAGFILVDSLRVGGKLVSSVEKLEMTYSFTYLFRIGIMFCIIL